jgi:segregation and condensation protein A
MTTAAAPAAANPKEAPAAANPPPKPVAATAEPPAPRARPAPAAATASSGDTSGTVAPTRFRVTLANFDGPFDLLLHLISAHRMDVTEVALSTVTDEFIAHLRDRGNGWDLDEASEFLVVAATLLDLKAARLLPQGDVEDEADLALLESRDLLFARLLAYRAFQQVATLLRELEAAALHRYPRAVALEKRYLNLLPEVELGVAPAGFAQLAASVFRPKPPPATVSTSHLHDAPVSVADETAVMVGILTDRGATTFADLVAGCTRRIEVVARFLGLLNLYRAAAVLFEQPEPLGPLTVRWSGEADDDLIVAESA